MREEVRGVGVVGADRRGCEIGRHVVATARPSRGNESPLSRRLIGPLRWAAWADRAARPLQLRCL